MSDCPRIVALLSDYLDRDLPPDTCGTIQAHLDACPNCRDAAMSLRRTVDLCRKYRSENVPGPLPETKHRELKAAFEKALSTLQREHGEPQR